MIDLLFSPPFLVKNIYTISLIISAVLLVIYSDLVFKFFLIPFFKKCDVIIFRFFKKKKYAHFFSRLITTIIFILYCYLGSVFLAKYLIFPVLFELRSILSLIVILFLYLISQILYNQKLRNKLLRV